MTLQTITRGAQALTISVIAAAAHEEAPAARASQGRGGGGSKGGDPSKFDSTQRRET